VRLAGGSPEVLVADLEPQKRLGEELELVGSMAVPGGFLALVDLVRDLTSS
jgi:hypothetical protein